MMSDVQTSQGITRKVRPECKVSRTFSQSVRVLSRWLATGLALLLLLSCPQAQTPGEYQVKAAFIYNFARFVEWPADAFSSTDAPFIIGLVGDDPFEGTLENAISGKSINGHKLVFRRVKAGPELRNCHILYLSPSEKRRQGQLIAQLSGAAVLTVTEAERGTPGGIISFVMDDRNVKFEINNSAASRARLKISSRLLGLAKAVS